MRLMPPACGNDREAHEPHRFAAWSSDTGQHGSCGGFTAGQVLVHGVIREVRAAMDRRELDRRPGQVLGPLRLEVHPAVRHVVAQAAVPDVDDSLEGMRVFGVPLVPVGDLLTGQWRLIELGPVLAEGPA